MTSDMFIVREPDGATFVRGYNNAISLALRMLELGWLVRIETVDGTVLAD